MKRISLLVLVAAATMIATGARVGVPSAVGCIYSPGTGNFEDANCTKPKENGNWLKVVELGKKFGKFWCAKVAAGKGDWEDPNCILTGGKKEYVLVYLALDVAGAPLSTGSIVALATTAQVEQSTILNTPSLGVKVTCTGGSSGLLRAISPFIEGETGGGAESLIFQGCSELTPPTCSVASEIATEPVTFFFEGNRLRFAPKTGKTLATLTFLGSCVIAGEQPIRGQATLGIPSGQEELASQPVEPLGTTENNSLELAARKAYLEKGKVLFKLASGSAWSFKLQTE